jgi:hypothetical protein
MHWLCTYATDDRKLFGLVVVENEDVIAEYAAKAGIAAVIKIHRVVRVLDPSVAATAQSQWGSNHAARRGATETLRCQTNVGITTT